MDDVGWSVLLIGVLTAITLFCSLNTLALRTFSRVKLQESFRARKKESWVERFVEKVEDYILTCSLLRLFSNVAILFLLFHLFVHRAYGTVIAFVVAVVLFQIFALAIPHSWAKYAGEAVLSHCYPVLAALRFCLLPLLSLFHLHDRIVRRLAGVAESTPEDEHEERQEEILNLVEQGHMEGVVDEEEMEMIENVLELGDTTAAEIMTPRTDVIGVRLDSGLEVVLKTISEAGHSRIPVYEKTIDTIVGMVYAKDLLLEIGNDAQNFELKQKMRKAYFVPETKSLTDLLHEFQNQKLHIAVVLDEYGGTAGLVTIEDILEELVGEIVDEYEETPPESIRLLSDNVAEVDARVYVDELNDKLDLNLPEEEDYDTIGGFVFSHLGYVPQTGETFEYDGLRITVVAAEERRIKFLKIEKIATEHKPQ